MNSDILSFMDDLDINRDEVQKQQLIHKTYGVSFGSDLFDRWYSSRSSKNSRFFYGVSKKEIDVSKRYNLIRSLDFLINEGIK